MVDLTKAPIVPEEDETPIPAPVKWPPTPLPLATPAGMLDEIRALHNMAGRMVSVYLERANRRDISYDEQDKAALLAREVGDLSNALRIARVAAQDMVETIRVFEEAKGK